MNNTDVVAVRDLVILGEAALTTGPFGTQLKASEYVEVGIPLINVRNIGFGSVRTADLEYLSDETVMRLDRHRLEPGDIVFGRKGAVERHAFITEQQAGWVQGSDCLRLRMHSLDFMPRFVSYFLLTEHHKQWMKNHCSGAATMASLNQDILGRIELPRIFIQTQKKIATILSAYDDLIEVNSWRVQILEEMAQAIYREWFVDFRYPGHQEVPLVDSDLGPIPKGWEATTIGSVSSLITRGVSPKYNDDSNQLVINQKCIRNGRLTLTKARHHKSKVPEAKLIRIGDVIINSTGVGTLGRVAQVNDTLGDTTIDSHVTLVRPDCAAVTAEYFGSQMLDMATEFSAMGVGSTGQTELSRGRIAEVRFLIPSYTVQTQYSKHLAPIRRCSEILLNEIKVLRATRDLLLPRLISGEIDVSDLDIDIGESAA